MWVDASLLARADWVGGGEFPAEGQQRRIAGRAEQQVSDRSDRSFTIRSDKSYCQFGALEHLGESWSILELRSIASWPLHNPSHARIRYALPLPLSSISSRSTASVPHHL